MKKIMLAGTVIASVAAFTGCSNITMLRIAELKQVEAHVDSLKADLAAKQDTIQQEQKNQNELFRLIRADMQVRFEELSQKFSTLESSISESKFKLSQIEKKTTDIQEQWKAKASADSTDIAKKNGQVEKIFQIAYGDYMAGRFDLAANGFLDVINQFPNAEQADDATYWMAECAFGKKETDKAEALFSDYLRKYREGKKVSSALYKLGLVFEIKKQSEKRKMVWQKLISGYPDSPEATMAKERLSKF